MAYRDASSFRSSHYFVSYLSQATALAAGIDTSPTRNWAVAVTRPWNIELPRSLVEVVINWNIPMHAWLKNCNPFSQISPCDTLGETLWREEFKTVKIIEIGHM